MSGLVARLLLSMLLLPLSAAVVVLTFLVLAPSNGPSVITVMTMWMFVYAFIGLYWIVLWRDVVRWTPSRVMLTLLSAAAALLAGGLVSVFIEHLFTRGGGGGPDWPAILMLTGAGVPVLWLFLTVLVWRETAAERQWRIARAGADTLGCPVCGYNLTGLRELRCPECGAEFTVEGLLAAQQGADDALAGQQV